MDVIHFNEADVSAANTAVIMANHGEMGHINNIYVNDLRVEHFDNVVHRLFSIRVNKSFWAAQDTPFGMISNIHLSNIRLDDDVTNNVILGKDDEHTVNGILLENIIINGEPIQGLSDLKIVRNEFAKNLRYANSYVVNGSFEQGGNGWQFTEHAKAVDLYSETRTTEKAYNGHYIGRLMVETKGEEKAWQQLTDLPDGKYRMTVRVKTTVAYDSAYLYAQTNSEQYTYEIAPSEAYTYIKFDGIQVTDGMCEIGVVLNASAPSQLDFDQVVFEMK